MLYMYTWNTYKFLSICGFSNKLTYFKNSSALVEIKVWIHAKGIVEGL